MAKTRRTIVLNKAAALLALVPLAALAGCGRRSPPVGDQDRARATFTDEAGRQITLRTAPTRRVVSLAPNVTELLFAIGAGEQLVGIDNYSDQPAAQVGAIAKVGSNYEPSIEKVVALAPDVVFTSLSANRRETAEALQRLGIPVFVTDTRAVLEMDRTFRSLGAITGHAREAEEQIRRLAAGLDAVARRVAGRPRVGVLVVVWDDPLYVAGRRTFTHDLIEIAGGKNIAADATGFVKYPLEHVLRLAPEVIVLPTHSAESQGARAVGYWSRWPELPAVRDKRVTAVEDAVISRPGARLVEGADLLARIIHPQANVTPP
ncbi:MAG: cobalamin-binding protein [Deltaproteobacteria bacterium]|nr:cobalamin-binding protein [Deltaproteobacteria bacterium]